MVISSLTIIPAVIPIYISTYIYIYIFQFLCSSIFPLIFPHIYSRWYSHPIHIIIKYFCNHYRSISWTIIYYISSIYLELLFIIYHELLFIYHYISITIYYIIYIYLFFITINPNSSGPAIVPRSSWQRKHLEEQGIAPQRVLEEARHLAEKQRKVKEHRDGRWHWGNNGETSWFSRIFQEIHLLVKVYRLYRCFFWGASWGFLKQMQGEVRGIFCTVWQLSFI